MVDHVEAPRVERTDTAADIAPGSREGFAASSNLSRRQRSLWSRVGAENLGHLVSMAYEVDGEVDADGLERALSRLAARDEGLRASFREVAGAPMRLVTRAAPPQLRVEWADAEAEPEDLLRRLLEQVAADPIDPKDPPLLRATLFTLGERRHVLAVALHRLVADEWSIPRLVDAAFGGDGGVGDAGGSEGEVGSAPASSPEESAPEGSPPGRLDGWRRLLGHDEQDTPAPRWDAASQDLSAPALTSAAATLPVPGSDSADESVAAGLAALGAVLGRSAGRSGIVLGLTRPGRRPAGRASGPQSTLSPLRVDLRGDPTLRELVDRARRARQAADEREGTALELLVDGLGADAHAGGRFCQVLIGAGGPTGSRRDDSCPQLALAAARPGLHDAPLACVDADGEGLRIALCCQSGALGGLSARTVLERVRALLRDGLRRPEVALSRLDWLAERERALVVGDWPQGPDVAAPSLRVHELFSQRAQRHPKETALRGGGSEVSYGQLEAWSNRLAGVLRQRGAGPERVVALCLDPSPALPAAILAVLKAGAAYLPLDPAHPPERLSYMLGHSGACLALTEGAHADRLGPSAPPLLVIDDDADRRAVADAPAARPDVAVDGRQLAYLIYTSGTTGRPKGVMVTHEGLDNYVAWARRAYEIERGRGTPLHSPITFDLTVTSLFPALTAGRTVDLIAGRDRPVSELAGLLREGDYSAVKLTPGHLELLTTSLDAEEARGATRRLVVGGEALVGERVLRWAEQAPDTVVTNEYGPTETVVGCCAHEGRAGEFEPGPVPIGRPIDNTRLYVLDERFQPVPPGVKGQLWIGGRQVTRGYASDPALTAKRYVPDPFGSEPGARLYRTGDVAYWDDQGRLRYAGRSDDQIQLRGYRIEPGEVERALSEHASVRETVVVKRQDSPGDERLVAYVVGSGSSVDPASLREHAAALLPDYMVPGTIVEVDGIPLTANGKVDERALPAPEATGERAPGEGGAPATPLEREVAEHFSSVLDLDGIGRDDDFLKLGGHSLLLARLMSKLTTRYDVDLPPERFFVNPTVAAIAHIIDVYLREGRSAAIEAATRPDLEGEAVVEDSLTPAGLPLARITDPDHVLVTGATGFLGAFLVKELLDRTPATVHALVRAAGPAAAQARLRRTMEGYGIWNDECAARVRVVVGDLEQPLLGIDPETFDELAATIDTIYHSGAKVNFVYPYSELRVPNVEGTKEVLRLACRTRAKGVHHLSAVDVFVRGEDRLIREDEALDASNVAGGYIQSKWVAERIVTTVRDRGLPAAVYRPWVTLGHSETGVAHTTDYTCAILKGCIQMEAAPVHTAHVNFMPVDYVARALVHVSLQEESYGGYFHFANPSAADLADVWQWVSEYGYELELLSYQDWRRRLAEVEEGNALYPMVPVLTSEHAADPDSFPEEARPRISTDNTDALCGPAGITCPPVDRDLCWRIIDHLVEADYLPPPS